MDLWRTDVVCGGRSSQRRCCESVSGWNRAGSEPEQANQVKGAASRTSLSNNLGRWHGHRSTRSFRSQARLCKPLSEALRQCTSLRSQHRRAPSQTYLASPSCRNTLHKIDSCRARKCGQMCPSTRLCRHCSAASAHLGTGIISAPTKALAPVRSIGLGRCGSVW